MPPAHSISAHSVYSLLTAASPVLHTQFSSLIFLLIHTQVSGGFFGRFFLLTNSRSVSTQFAHCLVFLGKFTLPPLALQIPHCTAAPCKFTQSLTNPHSVFTNSHCHMQFRYMQFTNLHAVLAVCSHRSILSFCSSNSHPPPSQTNPHNYKFRRNMGPREVMSPRCKHVHLLSLSVGQLKVLMCTEAD